jgi:amino acid transporter
LLLVYAFTGFEMALIPAGEARDPQRNAPFALLTSLAIVATVYILVQVVCIGVLPELAASNRPVADAGERFLGAAGASVITAGVVISIIGNLSVLILAAARLPFAMAGNRELPQVLAATHRSFRTPHAAIIVTGAVMLALALSGTFIYAATISTIARLLAYVAACSGLIVLRRRDKPPAQFKVPAGVAVAIAALVLIAWLLAHSTGREARDAAIAAITGLIIFGAYKLTKRKTAAQAAQIS